MNSIFNTTTLIFSLFIIIGCRITEKEKLDKILSFSELEIQENTYGGIGGAYGKKYLFTKSEDEMTVTFIKDNSNMTVSLNKKKQKMLYFFIQEAVKNNIPNKKMSSSCLTGFDTEYILKSGLTSLRLTPIEKCDSIFKLVIKNY